MKSHKFDYFIPLIGVLLLLLLWQSVATSGWVNPVLLPTPIATVQTLIQVFFQPEKSLAADLLATLRRTVQSFAIGAIVGIPSGVILGSSVRVYRSVEFVIDFCRSLPASTLIPLFVSHIPQI
jgi:ABC-type nitrate/sulfonate/bicarbonate transport system permease component